MAPSSPHVTAPVARSEPARGALRRRLGGARIRSGPLVAACAGVLLLPVVGLLQGVAAQPPTEQSDVERVVRTLAALEPVHLRDLEAVLGPLDRDPSVWEEAVGPLTRQRVSPGIGLVRVVFDFDLETEDPRQVANPRLASYEMVALLGQREASDILRDQLGKPRRIRRQGGLVFEHQRFYLDPLQDDGFRLLWYAETPDFAVPPRPRGEEERLIRDLRALIEDGFPRDRIERRLSRLERVPGAPCEEIREDSWRLEACPAGAEVFDRITLRFRPALPGYELVQAMGVEEPLVVATDARGTRVLADGQGRPPSVRGYLVEATVGDQDLEELDEPVRGRTAWRPTEALEVDALRFDREAPGD